MLKRIKEFVAYLVCKLLGHAWLVTHKCHTILVAQHYDLGMPCGPWAHPLAGYRCKCLRCNHVFDDTWPESTYVPGLVDDISNKNVVIHTRAE